MRYERYKLVSVLIKRANRHLVIEAFLNDGQDLPSGHFTDVKCLQAGLATFSQNSANNFSNKKALILGVSLGAILTGRVGWRYATKRATTK